MNVSDYPKRYKDNLGRVIYALENEFERTVFMYYGDTNRIKIKYHYINKDVYIDAFSRTGAIIFSTVSKNLHETHVERRSDGSIEFIVHPEKLRFINSLK